MSSNINNSQGFQDANLLPSVTSASENLPQVADIVGISGEANNQFNLPAALPPANLPQGSDIVGISGEANNQMALPMALPAANVPQVSDVAGLNDQAANQMALPMALPAANLPQGADIVGLNDQAANQMALPMALPAANNAVDFNISNTAALPQKINASGLESLLTSAMSGNGGSGQVDLTAQLKSLLGGTAGSTGSGAEMDTTAMLQSLKQDAAKMFPHHTVQTANGNSAEVYDTPFGSFKIETIGDKIHVSPFGTGSGNHLNDGGVQGSSTDVNLAAALHTKIAQTIGGTAGATSTNMFGAVAGAGAPVPLPHLDAQALLKPEMLKLIASYPAGSVQHTHIGNDFTGTQDVWVTPGGTITVNIAAGGNAHISEVLSSGVVHSYAEQVSTATGGAHALGAVNGTDSVMAAGSDAYALGAINSTNSTNTLMSGQGTQPITHGPDPLMTTGGSNQVLHQGTDTMMMGVHPVAPVDINYTLGATNGANNGANFGPNDVMLTIGANPVVPGGSTGTQVIDNSSIPFMPPSKINIDTTTAGNNVPLPNIDVGLGATNAPLPNFNIDTTTAGNNLPLPTFNTGTANNNGIDLPLPSFNTDITATGNNLPLPNLSTGTASSNGIDLSLPNLSTVTANNSSTNMPLTNSDIGLNAINAPLPVNDFALGAINQLPQQIPNQVDSFGLPSFDISGSSGLNSIAKITGVSNASAYPVVQPALNIGVENQETILPLGGGMNLPAPVYNSVYSTNVGPDLPMLQTVHNPISTGGNFTAYGQEPNTFDVMPAVTVPYHPVPIDVNPISSVTQNVVALPPAAAIPVDVVPVSNITYDSTANLPVAIPDPYFGISTSNLVPQPAIPVDVSHSTNLLLPVQNIETFTGGYAAPMPFNPTSLPAVLPAQPVQTIDVNQSSFLPNVPNQVDVLPIATQLPQYTQVTTVTNVPWNGSALDALQPAPTSELSIGFPPTAYTPQAEIQPTITINQPQQNFDIAVPVPVHQTMGSSGYGQPVVSNCQPFGPGQEVFTNQPVQETFVPFGYGGNQGNVQETFVPYTTGQEVFTNQPVQETFVPFGYGGNQGNVQETFVPYTTGQEVFTNQPVQETFVPFGYGGNQVTVQQPQNIDVSYGIAPQTQFSQSGCQGITNNISGTGGQGSIGNYQHTGYGGNDAFSFTPMQNTIEYTSGGTSENPQLMNQDYNHINGNNNIEFAGNHGIYGNMPHEAIQTYHIGGGGGAGSSINQFCGVPDSMNGVECTFTQAAGSSNCCQPDIIANPMAY